MLYFISLYALNALKICSGDPVWRLVRTSNPGGVKAPGVRFALWSGFFSSMFHIFQSI